MVHGSFLRVPVTVIWTDEAVSATLGCQSDTNITVQKVGAPSRKRFSWFTHHEDDLWCGDRAAAGVERDFLCPFQVVHLL